MQRPKARIENRTGGGNTSKISGASEQFPRGHLAASSTPTPFPFATKVYRYGIDARFQVHTRSDFRTPLTMRYPARVATAVRYTVYRCKPPACTYFAHHRCLTPRTRTGPSPGRASLQVLRFCFGGEENPELNMARFSGDRSAFSINRRPLLLCVVFTQSNVDIYWCVLCVQ